MSLPNIKKDPAFYDKMNHFLSKCFLRFNELVIYGSENLDRILEKDKPCLFSIAHSEGSIKDILAACQVFSKRNVRITFVGRKELFYADQCSKEFNEFVLNRSLREYITKPRPVLEKVIKIMLTPLSKIVGYKISNSIRRVGVIPFDVKGGFNKEAIGRIYRCLSEDNDKVVFFQYNGNQEKNPHHSYLHKANPGAAFMACLLDRKGYEVPIVNISIYHVGNKKPIILNTGRHFYAKDFPIENRISEITKHIDKDSASLLNYSLERIGIKYPAQHR